MAWPRPSLRANAAGSWAGGDDVAEGDGVGDLAKYRSDRVHRRDEQELPQRQVTGHQTGDECGSGNHPYEVAADQERT